MFTRWLVALALLCATAVVADAQTTTFVAGANCANGTNGTITISGGGLTLTSNSAIFVNLTCVANVGKFGKTNANSGAGLFYYTFTPTSAISQQAFGVQFSLLLAPGGDASVNTNFLGGSWGIGFFNAIWNVQNKVVNSVPTPSTGVKGAIVVNLATDPWQFWETNSVANLVCDGAGHSGSTHPMWNGNCASDPSLAGTSSYLLPSYPTFDGSGVPFYVEFSQVFPAVTLGHNDSATFSFADDAAVDALLPVGYKPWNDNSGSTCTEPKCPNGLVTLNVANAPGWSAGATLHKGSRVLAGPGWTPGSPGHFNNGQALYLWAAPGVGGGTTPGSADAGFSSCPAPANAGGGLNGLIPGSWLSATRFTDANGNGWYCLAKIDYPTLTSVYMDTDKNWSVSTGTCAGTDHRPGCYWMGDEVLNNGNAYIIPIGVGSQLCQSATSGSGPTGSTPSTDGSCNWQFVGTQVYSPQTYIWPLQQVPPTNPFNSATELRYNWTIDLIVYYGGADNLIYQAGVNKELSPLEVGPHSGFIAESPVYCPGAFAQTDIANSGYFGYCTGLFNIPHLTVAPGDSFVDNVTATDPLRIDDTKGVEFYSNVGGGSPTYLSYDNILQFDRFQIKSESAQAWRGCCNETQPELFANAIWLQRNFLDGGGSTAGTASVTLALDADSILSNNVIIWHGTAAGGSPMYLKFGSVPITYNTIICTSGITDSVGWFEGNATGGGDTGMNPPYIGNLILGCSVPYAFSFQIESPFTNANINNNMTDVASVPGASGTNGSATGTNTFTDTVANAFTSGMIGQAIQIGPALQFQIVTVPDAGHITVDRTLPTFSGQSWFIGTRIVPAFNSSSTFQRAQMNGFTGGVTPANQLVNPTIGASFDARIKNTSANVYGAGADFTYGSFFGTLTPGADILGVNRPISGRFDIGAKMFTPSGPAAIGGGGRRWFP